MIQILQYVVPLLTFPYLTRVLTPEGFGDLSFSISIVSIVGLISQYSFGLTATSKLAQLKNDLSNIKKSEYFWVVTQSKLTLFFISILALLVITNVSASIFSVKYIVTAALVTVIGNIFISSWYYQALEKMKVLAVIVLIGRVVTLPFIFILVKNEGDVVIAAVIQSSGFLLSGIFSLYYAFRNLDLRLKVGTRKDVFLELKDSLNVFVATLGVSCYTLSIPVIIGLLTSNIYVGYYNIAETIRKLFMMIFQPIYQTVYPRVNTLIVKSKSEAIDVLRKYLLISLFLALLSLIVINVQSMWLIQMVVGESYNASIATLEVMSLTIVFSVINNFFGVQTLIPFGHKKEFSKSITIVSIFSFVYSIVLILFYNALGAAISVVITEIIVFLSLLKLHKNNNLGVYTMKKISFK